MKFSVYESTGYTPVVFEARNVSEKKSMLMLASVTGGGRDHFVSADKINLGIMIGNKLVVGAVNANREYFKAGIYAFARAELELPG